MTGSAPGPALAGDEMRVVAELLAAAWGQHVPVRDAEVLWGRANVVRVRLADGRPAVVKRRPGPERGDAPDRDRSSADFQTELAALEYLNAMPEPVAPRLLGADLPAGLIVMEDLGAGATLADSLMAGDRAQVEADLAAYARSLAAMHAWTSRHPGELAALRDRYAARTGGGTRLMAALARGTRPFLALAAELGLPAGGVEDEIAGLGGLLAATGFAALVHGDGCPDNVRFLGGACRFLDFETAAWGAAAIDAVFLLAPFPSCWCFARLPDDVAGPATETYRSALAAAGIGLGPDWQAALAAALVCWIVARGRVLGRLLSEDPEWGTTTMRPRLLAWLRSFLDAAGGTSELSRLAGLSAALLAELSRRWPEAEVPDYPALAGPGAALAVVPDEWRPGQ
ncbi:MAG TPA: phosphotransferase [Streptosporangiaceae bacterium]